MKIRSGFAESLNRLYDTKRGALLFAVLSALLTALTLIFDILSVAVFVSLIPLILILIKRCENGKKPFSSYAIAFAWSFCFYIVIYHWFWYLWPMDFLGVERPMALLITLFCWIGLSLLQAIGTAFVGPLFCLAYKKGGPAMAPFVFAAAWTVLEYLQSLTWMGVPWARLAISQTVFPAAIQTAALFGSLFVGLLIALVNGLLALAVRYFIMEGKKSVGAIRLTAIALAVVLLNVGYGLAVIGVHDETGKGIDSAVKVTVIQGNIASGDKWADNSNSNSMNVYESLTLEADSKDHADIVVWPETVLTTYAKENPVYRSRILELAENTGSIIFVGSLDAAENEDGNVEEYNAVIAFFPGGICEERSYRKQHLVPFGEYMPMRTILDTLLPFMTELNMLEDDLAQGEGSEIIETQYGSIGRLICFDSIYPDLARKSTADGAEYILLSTNDSWYRDSASAYQHNAHAILRAVENRRYIVRAASTGISAVITSEGNVIDMIAPLESGYITSYIFPEDGRTLYSYVGDIIVIPCAALLATLSFFSKFCVKKHKKNNETDTDQAIYEEKTNTSEEKN